MKIGKWLRDCGLIKAAGLWGKQKGSYGIEFADIIPELGWLEIHMTLGGGQKSWGFIGAVPMGG